ncbi:MAG TPA: transcription termination/antitermination protein NusG [Parachlamydiales bacterium]|nr:MAG: transcription termination/antitermination protein NusG [Chlamydiae bacterium GWA2_50_15]OGN58352.1 MAG: transcription termination/antitermination protein NusG [Chlamydiae bacterium RIFCSPHIGHO2_02_FULL_49_29]OGN64145.1 MAG: transcription termination/antitermination protein NusG [Chlamydiae bacterium RIFCSPHIGHO2_12_FULL_49_32]OGN68215.1 MAG: transcription termination/antitermination protein NusG [Chlamydiae bacterium RIFCSPLOWO2_02_FULL_49_12]OGN72890.1 MAG: transcription termination/an
MQKWYVVQVVSSQEKKVKKALEDNRESQGMNDLISEVLVPTENVSEVKKGEQRITEKRMWPGYIFVKMNLTDDAWMYVRNTGGVLGFLGGEKAIPLTDNEVEKVLADLEEKKKEVVQKHRLAVGDRVKIIDGVFVNFIGNVIEVFPDKGRLSAMVSIFGRETRVDDLEFWQVEQVLME